jgi:hypothetical protein
MAEAIMMILLGGLIFWLWMFADWLYHEPKGTDKIIWFLILLILNVVGAFLYLCLRYKENRKSKVHPV